VPIPRDFLQDASGDLDFSQGLRQTPDLPTFVRQKFSENFNFFQGEWFLDTTKGLPMFKYVIGQKFDGPLLNTLYRRAAVKTHGVGSVDALSLEYDNRLRLLSVAIDARTVEGEEVPAAEPFIVEIT
jgi:hypothetical protein